MERAHKQRLVGGVVLVALALILVPTILDFSQDDPSPLQHAEMPDAPDAMDMETLPLEVWSEPVDPEVDGGEQIIETPAAEPEVVQQAEADAQQAADAASQGDETSTPTAPEPEPEVQAEAPSAPEPKPKPKAQAKPVIPEGATAWVVQVASFSDQSKAFTLRDRLRSAGHPTFIERGQSRGTTIYRVKVGPVLQRAEADQLKQKVDKQTRLDSLVMQYK